jgi:hypothetical protein
MRQCALHCRRQTALTAWSIFARKSASRPGFGLSQSDKRMAAIIPQKNFSTGLENPARHHYY